MQKKKILLQTKNEIKKKIGSLMKRYFLLAESSNDYIFVADRQFKIVYINPFATKALHNPRQKIVGQPIEKLFPYQDFSDRHKDIKKVFVTGRDLVTEKEFAFAKDRKVWLNTKLSPIKEDGKIIAVLGISRDITKSKQLEEEMRLAEQKYSALAESANDFIFMVNKRFEVTYVNSFTAKMLKRPLSAIIGQKIDKVFPYQDLSDRRQSIKKIFSDGRIIITEKKFIFAKNRELWLNTKLVAIKEKGKVTAVLGIARDITKSKKIAEILQISEIRYRRLFESAKDGILILNAATGAIDDVNPYLLKMLDFSRKKIIGKKIWEIGIFKDVIASQKAFKELQRKKYIRYDNLPLKTRSGKNFEVEFISNVYKIDHTNVIQCNVRNITERRKLEEKTRQTEQKYITLVEKSNDGIVIIQDGKAKFFNPQMAKMAGYKKKLPPTKNFLEFIAPKDRDRIGRLYMTRIKGGHPESRYEFEMLRVDKKTVPVEVNSSLIDYEGKPAVLAVIRDMTRAKEIEQIKTDFVSIASHQLKTPLTGIKWFTELLLKDGLTPEGRDFAKQINAGNERMVRLVDDLLNVSRIETGKKFDILPVKDNIFPLIVSVLEEQKKLAEIKNIRITYEKKFPCAFVLKFDREKMYQVFQNIISNALKYGRVNGNVKIGCDLSKDKKMAVFHVADDGIGIPEKEKHRIFEKFFRAENAFGVNTDGTGLGLFIAKAIIDGHGGKIWFKSIENKGTTVYISLPLT